jgi:hypothetical protein
MDGSEQSFRTTEGGAPRRPGQLADLRTPGRAKGLAVVEVCTHLDEIGLTSVPSSVPGCEDCLNIGGRWVHLRICLSCGHVGCCDSSPNRHATAHNHGTGHPIIRSLERGEDWCWCYTDKLSFVVDLPVAGAEASCGQRRLDRLVDGLAVAGFYKQLFAILADAPNI